MATGSTLRFTRMTGQSTPTDCTTEPQALYSGALTGGSHTESISGKADPKIAASPAGDKIVEAFPFSSSGPKPAVDVRDATAPTLSRSAEVGFAGPDDPTTVPRDVAVSPDGALALAAAGVSGTKVLSTTDLSEVAPGHGPLPDGTSSTAVAFSPDGSLLARGGPVDGTAADLLVQSAGPAQDATLAVDVVKAPTDLALDTPTEATMSGVEIHGTLTTPGVALPAGTTVGVCRVTKKGVIDLPAVTVGSDGSFTVDDVPPAKGSTLYVVSYDGDALHEASADFVTVDVTK
ncbi:hypothetical protein ACFSL4_27425 [Streptomyces caeni]|uniref:Ig-like domain repeat protein n=1 Tax=Streptomyces caeni TaxID=2307231 RepID=A0ABW4IWQ0_9ACTN